MKVKYILTTSVVSIIATITSCMSFSSDDSRLAEEKRAIIARREKYEEYSKQDQFCIICLQRANEFGYQMPDLEVAQKRAVFLNPQETSAVKECMRYLALYDGLEPTSPAIWSITQGGYILICNNQIVLTIGANGENTLVGLTNPPLWKNVMSALEGAIKESQKRVTDK